jgi:hypothetical protein
MEISHHANQRSQQRAISKEELLFLQDFGDVTFQKGGFCVLTVLRENVPDLSSTLKTALKMVASGQVTGEKIKRKTKRIKMFLESINAKHPPYFVMTEKEKVLTCGRQFGSLRNKNKHGVDNYV